MGRKLRTNPKSTEARERKEQVKRESKIKQQKQQEDLFWQAHGDGNATKKQEEKQARRQAQLQKKRELKALEEKEIQEISHKYTRQPKTTQHLIRSAQQIREQKEAAEEEKRVLAAKRLVPQMELGINVNRALAEQRAEAVEKYGAENIVDARTLDDAVSALQINATGKNDEDKHPERRMKAAYRAYEEQMLPEMKQDFPSLKLSQLKKQIFQDWQKSPQNPMVQARMRR